jgi:hypothetical protein
LAAKYLDLRKPALAMERTPETDGLYLERELAQSSQPLRDASVVGASAPSASAEAVRPVSALSRRSLWRGGTGLRPFDDLALAVQVSAVVLAVWFRLIGALSVPARRNTVLRLRRWLRLGNQELNEKNSYEEQDRKGPLHGASIVEMRPV